MNLTLADFHLFREFLKIEVSLPPLSLSLPLSLSDLDEKCCEGMEEHSFEDRALPPPPIFLAVLSIQDPLLHTFT